MRQWLEVKLREVFDAVCPAVIGRIERPEYVVVGLPVEGRLRIVGRSTVLSAKAARELATYLEPSKGVHPWPEVITETMLNRFSKDKGPVAITRVEPLFLEISVDIAWTGNAFRHLQPRPELDPESLLWPDYQHAGRGDHVCLHGCRRHAFGRRRSGGRLPTPAWQ